MSNYSIDAAHVDIAEGVEFGAGLSIRAERVVIGRGVRLESSVEIVADSLEIGAGSQIATQSRLLAPDVRIGRASRIGAGVQAQLNDHLVVGSLSNVGSRVQLSGRGVATGDYLWMKDDVIVGGGGALGPRSFLTIGDRTTIIDKCFLNVSEEIRIGSDTALSFNVAVLTHGAWQPVLLGYGAKFGPVSIGSHAVIYFNSVILPGVTVGDYSTVSSLALVTSDVPPYCLAMGNPASLKRGPENYPKRVDAAGRDGVIRGILRDYLSTLEPKGVRVLSDSVDANGRATVQYDDAPETLWYAAADAAEIGDADIALSEGPLRGTARAHFDLRQRTVAGSLSAIGEDLRDYLRRRTIRVYTENPFRSLPLANVARLKRRRAARD